MIHYAPAVRVTDWSRRHASGAAPAHFKTTEESPPVMKASQAVASALLACLVTINLPDQTDAQALHADLVSTNAKVRTLDRQRPAAEAVAVLGNRIVAVGPDAEVRRYAGSRTRRIDARGALVLP